MPRIKPMAISEVFKQAFGLEERSRGDREVAREVSLTDGANHVAIVCWKRTLENLTPTRMATGSITSGLSSTTWTRRKLELGPRRGTAQPPPQGRPVLDGRASLLRADASARRYHVRLLARGPGDDQGRGAGGPGETLTSTLRGGVEAGQAQTPIRRPARDSLLAGPRRPVIAAAPGPPWSGDPVRRDAWCAATNRDRPRRVG